MSTIPKAPGGPGAPAIPSVTPQSFAALRNPGYRPYLSGNALAMMADSVEHVITYWVAFQKFHSPALGGFAVLSHWLPFLMFSALWGRSLTGSIPAAGADRHGAVHVRSVAWSVLILTDCLQMWHAVVLLLIHGCAGVLWGPPSQVLIHDIVPGPQLSSAVRLMATRAISASWQGRPWAAPFSSAFGPSHGPML